MTCSVFVLYASCCHIIDTPGRLLRGRGVSWKVFQALGPPWRCKQKRKINTPHTHIATALQQQQVLVMSPPSSTKKRPARIKAQTTTQTRGQAHAVPVRRRPRGNNFKKAARLKHVSSSVLGWFCLLLLPNTCTYIYLSLIHI